MTTYPDDDAIMGRLKKLTPLAEAMLVPCLTEAEIKVALGEDEVENCGKPFFFKRHNINVIWKLFLSFFK